MNDNIRTNSANYFSGFRIITQVNTECFHACNGYRMAVVNPRNGSRLAEIGSKIIPEQTTDTRNQYFLVLHQGHLAFIWMLKVGHP